MRVNQIKRERETDRQKNRQRQNITERERNKQSEREKYCGTREIERENKQRYKNRTIEIN